MSDATNQTDERARRTGCRSLRGRRAGRPRCLDDVTGTDGLACVGQRAQRRWIRLDLGGLAQSERWARHGSFARSGRPGKVVPIGAHD